MSAKKKVATPAKKRTREIILDDESDAHIDDQLAKTPRPESEQSVSSLMDEARERQKEREEMESKDRPNNWREDARLELSRLAWVDITGKICPVKWSVGARAYYEVLCSAAGLNRVNGDPIEAEIITIYIWTWLATHNQETYFQRIGTYGHCLKDDPDLWLRLILDWADTEFPMGADQSEREQRAVALRGKLWQLVYSARAEPRPDQEPDDGTAPKN